MAQDEPLKPIMSVKEYAKWADIGETYLRRKYLILPGFPKRYVGRKIVILRQQADDWLVEYLQKYGIKKEA